MSARFALETACILGLFLVLLGCESTREPVPAQEATPDRIVTATPMPSATPLAEPTYTKAPAESVHTPTPEFTASQREVEPTDTPDPTDTPSPTEPALVALQPTDGPIKVEAMPSRDHFASQMKISDVVPGGYSTVPPTSGRHWGAWSDCGHYNHPLPDELIVHNLEHGNIIVSYNLVSDAEVAALRAAVASIPLAEEYAIVRRYPAIPEGMVALTTWGVLDRMEGVDPERIAKFFTDYPGNTGPEFPNGLPCTTGIDMTQSSGG